MGLTYILIFLGVILVAAIVGFAFVMVGNGDGRYSGLRDMMGRGNVAQGSAVAASLEEQAFDVDKIKEFTGRSKAVKQTEDLSSKLFKAGMYARSDVVKFKKMQVISAVAWPIGMALVMFLLLHSTAMLVVGLVGGLFAGLIFPHSRLDKKIRLRQEELLYYLPLVIEQVSIGVSSSLDIGPCIANIVSMATERSSHNPVTQMFVHVEKLIKSGLNLEDALKDVGEASGMVEVKHAFMFLAQCSKHGGEISKQLQELADSIMVQRQVQVEKKITALPVAATGPLATVFAGFFALLLAGLMVKLMSAFGS